MAANNALANRRSVMNLFSAPACPYCHRTRLVLAEKDITFDTLDVDLGQLPEDLSELNPYNTVPTLVDRDLVLYDSRVIIEYLDERFPHPPLMPVDPVSRAKTRLALHRVEADWYPLMEDILIGTEKVATKARKELRESLISSAEIFTVMPYFLSQEFSLVDATIAPVLWRLPILGIELPKEAQPVLDYAERLFERETFRESLSETEREMRL
ncbi:MAG: glutathione S-transferase N-terminal domain-containing protein [Gammaproteobacteria bacterium]|nr:glutathione S-transferase N-terminal domain-containing protein [Gammaproteobacteria bacterium]